MRTLLVSKVLLFSVLCAASHAAITLDGSLGPSGPLTGPNFVISHDLGQVRGSDLLHSFGQFNVLTGERATNCTANLIWDSMFLGVDHPY